MKTDQNTSSELNRYSLQYQQSPQLNQPPNNLQENQHEDNNENDGHLNELNLPLSPSGGQRRLHHQTHHVDKTYNVDEEEMPTDPDMINKLILIGETAI